MNISKLHDGINDLLRQNNPGRTEQDKMTSHKPESEQDPSRKTGKTVRGDKVSVSGIWYKVARDINVRNATPREIISLSSQLYTAGVISYDDHINLSFQPEINPDSASADSSFSHNRKDYIALWQQRGEKVVRSGGDRSQIEDSQRIQSILKYVNSLK